MKPLPISCALVAMLLSTATPHAEASPRSAPSHRTSLLAKDRQGRLPAGPLTRADGIKQLVRQPKKVGAHDRLDIRKDNLFEAGDQAPLHVVSIRRHASRGGLFRRHEVVDGVVGVDARGVSWFAVKGTILVKNMELRLLAVADYDREAHRTTLNLVGEQGVEQTYHVQGKVTKVQLDRVNYGIRGEPAEVRVRLTSSVEPGAPDGDLVAEQFFTR